MSSVTEIYTNTETNTPKQTHPQLANQIQCFPGIFTAHQILMDSKGITLYVLALALVACHIIQLDNIPISYSVSVVFSWF